MSSGFSARTHDPFLGTSYRVLESLGSGGTAVVYLVERKQDGARVVAKVLRHALAEDRDLVRHMRREARVMQSLVHPHVVRILDFAELKDGRPFIVMEHLEGRTLEDELRERYVDLHDAVLYVQQALSAMSAVHRLKIVHRDITPRNLFLNHQTGKTVLKVLDFGFSKFLEHGSSGLLTRDDVLVGTPEFTSPEAVRGDTVDEQSDLYAIGLVLFVLLTGEHPFADIRQSRQIYLAHVWRPMPAPSTLREDIPSQLDSVVGRALAKRVEERYATAEEFLEALSRVKLSRPTQSGRNAGRGP